MTRKACARLEVVSLSPDYTRLFRKNIFFIFLAQNKFVPVGNMNHYQYVPFSTRYLWGFKTSTEGLIPSNVLCSAAPA
jgi:hypothetical protein